MCFVDDLMMFVERTKRSIKWILYVFDEFGKMSGLHISLEKLKLFMAGVSLTNQSDITEHFCLQRGDCQLGSNWVFHF